MTHFDLIDLADTVRETRRKARFTPKDSSGSISTLHQQFAWQYGIERTEMQENRSLIKRTDRIIRRTERKLIHHQVFA